MTYLADLNSDGVLGSEAQREQGPPRKSSSVFNRTAQGSPAASQMAPRTEITCALYAGPRCRPGEPCRPGPSGGPFSKRIAYFRC